MNKLLTLLTFGVFLLPNALLAQDTTAFSSVPVFGDSTSYLPTESWLWDIIEDGGDLRYGIIHDKEMGGNRTNIVPDHWYGYDFYVAADAKLFKRVWGAENEPLYEDADLFFLYSDASNFAKAEFYNTTGLATGAGNDPFGLSGFTAVVEGVTYKFKKADKPEDLVEGTPAERCIPFIGDTSFYDWNNVKVTRKGTILSMIVNGAVYFSMDIDTLSVYQSGDSLVAVPQSVKDFLKGQGQIGIGTGNDKLYFDNVEASYIAVQGQFSEIPFFGEASNYAAADPWLWDLVVDEGNMRYGITMDKEMGGNRMNILKNDQYGYDFYVTADAKLFKRVWGAENEPLYEDADLFFLYTDANNYVKAEFFNTTGLATGAGNDPFGLSGFTAVVEGVPYKFKKADAPADEVEGTPAERCIPFVNDASFNDWNNIKITRKGTILSMLVNGSEYFSMDIDTLTVYQSGPSTAEVPQSVKDRLMGFGLIGIGTGNDKVYFDNVVAGFMQVEGQFSDIENWGDASMYAQNNPWLWAVLEDGGDTRFAITAEKWAGGDRKAVNTGQVFTGDYFAEAELKLSKRFDGEPDAAKFEDGGFVISYTDPNNFANAFYSVSSATRLEEPLGYDATGLSGFYFMIDGHQYRVVKSDAPADEVEGIPAESCLPYENDASFDDWNKIRVERKGTVLTMLVNGHDYFSVDFDTVTVAADYPTSFCEGIVPIPQKCLDMILGQAKIGIMSANDKAWFDNVNAGVLLPNGVPQAVDAAACSIYPNPVSSHLTISGRDGFSNVEIFSLTGQKITSVVTGGNESVTIDASGFKAGMYMVKVKKLNGVVVVSKFIKR